MTELDAKGNEDAPRLRHAAPSRLTSGTAGVLGALLLATVFVRSQNPDAFNFDVGVFLHFAERALSGAQLYVDLVDENPPLIFWLSMPPVALARWIGVEPIVVFDLAVALVSFACAALCYRVMRTAWPDSPPAYSMALLALLLCLELLASGLDYGQRDVLLLTLAVPYLFAGAARAAGRPVPLRLALAAGSLASVGLSLKPHFVVLWLAVEGWLLFAAPGQWRRAENLVIVVGGASYAVLVAVFSWEYFGVLFASMQLLDVYYSADLPSLLLGPTIVLVASATVVLGVVRSSSIDREVRAVLFVAMLGFTLIASLQGKGWPYHYYPARATALLLLGVVVLGLVTRAGSLRGLLRPGAAAIPLIVLLMLSAWGVRAFATAYYNAFGPGSEKQTLTKVLRDLVIERAWRQPIFVMSTTVVPGFPLVNLSGSPWAGRFSCLWFLAGFYTPEEQATVPFPYREPDEMGELERRAFDAVIEDLETLRPQLLIVDASPSKLFFGKTEFQLLRYYQRHPRFAAIFAKYDYVAEVAAYRVFERALERRP